MFVYIISMDMSNLEKNRNYFKRWVTLNDPLESKFGKSHEICSDQFWMGFAGNGIDLSIIISSQDTDYFIYHGLILEQKIYNEVTSGRIPNKNITRNANGQFLYLYVNTMNNVVECGTDILGIRPLYIDDEKHPKFISNYSSLCGLFAGKLDFDPETCIDMVIKNAILPQSTLLKGIYRLRRGCYVSVNNGSSKVFSNNININTNIPSKSQVLEELIISAKILNNIPSFPMIGLTGGKDSRLALAILKTSGIYFETATHNHPCTDSIIAEKLALLLGCKHWKIRRDKIEKTFKYLQYLQNLPLCDGVLEFPAYSASFKIHDFLSKMKLIHIGGLGGEVARAYWDQAEAQFSSPSDAIKSRFFQNKFNCMYRTNEKLAESFENWNSFISTDSGQDPFLSLQIAYLDNRLRGFISPGLNSFDFPFTWPLASLSFYKYALNMDRKTRQAGLIYEDLINNLCPELNSITWAAGTAGDYSKKNYMARLRRGMGSANWVHYVKGIRDKLKPSPSNSIEYQFYLDIIKILESNKAVFESLINIDALRVFKLNPLSYKPVLAKLISIYYYHCYIKSLSDQQYATDYPYRYLSELNNFSID